MIQNWQEAAGISQKKMYEYLNIKRFCEPESMYYESGDIKKSCKEIENSEDNPERDFIRKEEIKLFHEGWNNLSEEERTILSLRTTYGTDLEEPKSLRQVTEIMGSNRTTIGEKGKKALSHFRSILQDQGLCA